MSEMCYFSTKVQKSPSTGGSPPQRPLTFDFGELAEVAWFGQIVFFQTDYDKIEL